MNNILIRGVKLVSVTTVLALPLLVLASSSDKVTVCHATSSVNNPYVVIAVSSNALLAHLAHGDIYPVPDDSCEATPTPTPPVDPF